MEAGQVIVEGNKLAIGYAGKQGQTVHRDLNFRLCCGEFTCLLGANGSGKSTLLRTLAAAQPPLSGSLTLFGKPVSAYDPKERSRLIGLVLTDKTQTGGLSVYDLVSLGRQPHTGFFGRLSTHDKEAVSRSLEAVGMLHKADSYMAQLSDGERQKVMIAKALVQECPLILLDEPTAFLDVVSRIEIMTLLHRIAATGQKAVLMSTHDVEQALVLADRLWLMTGRYGLECGCTEDLILANRMDSLFEFQPDIRFDLMHGGFSPEVKGKKFIVLETADEVLRHWTQNALNRHDYFCLMPGQQTEFHGLPVLKVISPDQILLEANGTEICCSSFENLFHVLSCRS